MMHLYIDVYVCVYLQIFDYMWVGLGLIGLGWVGLGLGWIGLWAHLHA